MLIRILRFRISIDKMSDKKKKTAKYRLPVKRGELPRDEQGRK